MTTTPATGVSALRALYASGKLADIGDAGDSRRSLKVNTHIHLPPNFSAFETVHQAVDLAREQGIAVLGASNYYDFSVYAEFSKLAAEADIFPLYGLEIIALIDQLVSAGVKINDPGNPGKMYLCGKGIVAFSPMSDTASRLMGTIRDNDSARMAAVADKLRGLFAVVGVDTGLDANTIKQRIVARHGTPIEWVAIQERHIAQAFQEVLFELVPVEARTDTLTRLYGVRPKAAADSAVGTQNDIRSYLMKAGKPGYVPETFVDYDHAHSLILALGGIPSYPVLADGADPICPFEENVTRLVADLKARHIPAAEFIPNRNAPDVLSAYVHALRDAGIIVTAGTEHNTLDLIPIEPVCAGGEPIPDDIKDIFWEGACVLAAHQYLRANETLGVVTDKGDLQTTVGSEGSGAPISLSADEAITWYARLGAEVIYAIRSTGEHSASA